MVRSVEERTVSLKMVQEIDILNKQGVRDYVADIGLAGQLKPSYRGSACLSDEAWMRWTVLQFLS